MMEGPTKNDKPEDNLEAQLSPEVLEMVMEKVSDINQKNGAVHVLNANLCDHVPEKPYEDIKLYLAHYEKSKNVSRYLSVLGGVIRDGLLGNEYGHKYPETMEEIETAKLRLSGTKKERWLRDVKKRGPVTVFFNIVGRDIDSIEDSEWLLEVPDQIAVVFSLESFKEELEEAQKFIKSKKHLFDYKGQRGGYDYIDEPSGGNVKFKTHHFGSHLATRLDKDGLPTVLSMQSEGFALTFRVAPRWLRAIIFKVDRKPTQEEIEKTWEDFNARRFTWEKPVELNDEFIRVYTRKTVIDKGKDANEKRAEEIVHTMVSSTQDSNKFLPVYDIYGNLWWPKQMSYEEVKRFVEERDKQKENEK